MILSISTFESIIAATTRTPDHHGHHRDSPHPEARHREDAREILSSLAGTRHQVITGVALNTIFLVREVRRNEQHNNFINAVTHELKTPIASMRLYLETLQSRPVEESKRKQFANTWLTMQQWPHLKMK